jgi:hypothetical protein
MDGNFRSPAPLRAEIEQFSQPIRLINEEPTQ